MADPDLLARHAGGDVEAFGEVVRRHRDRLWAVALRTLGDPEEAADAVQDALVKAFRSARSGAGYRGDAAVTTWLHRIVVNACLDRVRSRTARPVTALPSEDVPSGRDDTADTLTAIVVRDALAALPVEQRAALVLVDMAGWSVADAAVILDVAPGTVKSRCARGRARLLPLLGGERNRPGAADVPPASEGGPRQP
jgi:RNA polymerase sigma-70 factor (ECF subfamily)